MIVKPSALKMELVRVRNSGWAVDDEEFEDGLAIEGSGGARIRGDARVASKLDHRIAMSMAVAGLGAANPVEVDDVAPVATSYPDFFRTLDVLTA